MQSKFFTLAVNLLAVCLASTITAPAQKSSPTPAPGYIRFWNMLPLSNGAFDLRKMGGSPAGTSLASNVISYRYSSYMALPIGKYRLGVFRAGDDKTPLKVMDLDLLPDTFFTVLVSPGKIDLINDTVNPKTTSGNVTIRNFFPGVTVGVSAGLRALAKSLPYGLSYDVSALSLSRFSLTLSGLLPNGKPVQSSVDADFKSSKRATVLIIPDSYGRFRTRVTVDGANF